LDQMAYVGVSPSKNIKLISREILFEVNVFQKYEKHTWTSHTDRQTDV